MKIKTKLIRIPAGYEAELFIARRNRTCRYYSTVGDHTDGAIRKTTDPGLRLSMTVKGGTTISICISKKKAH
jgi:hypothetical protein